MTKQNAITHLAHKIIGCKTTGESKADGVNVVALEMATIALEEQEPERKNGKWIIPSRNPEFVNKEFFSDCSLCGFTTMDETNFCPHCGAKMGEEK